MADTDDSLVREINEEIRREQFAKFWDRYGVIALVGVSLFIGSILGFQYWQSSKLATAQEFGAKYQQALELAAENKNEDATKLLMQIEKDAPKGYAVLARLKLAAGQAEAGKTTEAVKTYEAIINDGGADQLLADYARLQAASLRVGEADWTEMQNRLNDLTGDESAWRFSARELLGLAALRAGKLDAARQPLRQLLADRATPRAMRARATIMMGMIAQKELSASKDEAAAKTGEKPMKPGKDKSSDAKSGAKNSN